eukprot:2837347-Pyramimonas_sp.AAC.1
MNVPALLAPAELRQSPGARRQSRHGGPGLLPKAGSASRSKNLRVLLADVKAAVLPMEVDGIGPYVRVAPPRILARPSLRAP